MFGFTIVRTRYIKALEKFAKDSDEITRRSKLTHMLIQAQEKLMQEGNITGPEFTINCEKIINDNLSNKQSKPEVEHS